MFMERTNCTFLTRNQGSIEECGIYLGISAGPTLLYLMKENSSTNIKISQREIITSQKSGNRKFYTRTEKTRKSTEMIQNIQFTLAHARDRTRFFPDSSGNFVAICASFFRTTHQNVLMRTSNFKCINVFMELKAINKTCNYFGRFRVQELH